MKIALKVLAAVALAFLLYDYYNVRADAICAHNAIVHHAAEAK